MNQAIQWYCSFAWTNSSIPSSIQKPPAKEKKTAEMATLRAERLLIEV